MLDYVSGLRAAHHQCSPSLSWSSTTDCALSHLCTISIATRLRKLCRTVPPVPSVPPHAPLGYSDLNWQAIFYSLLLSFGALGYFRCHVFVRTSIHTQGPKNFFLDFFFVSTSLCVHVSLCLCVCVNAWCTCVHDEVRECIAWIWSPKVTVSYLM